MKRWAAVVAVIVLALSVSGSATLSRIAGPVTVTGGSDYRDYPEQVALVVDNSGNSHILYHPRQTGGPTASSLAYAMLSPDGSPVMPTATIYPQTKAIGPVSAALTGSGKVFVAFNQADDRAGRNGDGEGHFMLLDPAGHLQNAATPLIAVSDTIFTANDNTHSHLPSIKADKEGNVHAVWWDGNCCNSYDTSPSAIHYAKFGPNGQVLIPDTVELTPTASVYDGDPIALAIDARGNAHVAFSGMVVPAVTYQTLQNPTRFVVDWFEGANAPVDAMNPTHEQLVLFPDGHFVTHQIDPRGVEKALRNNPALGYIGPNLGNNINATKATPLTSTATSFSFVTDTVLQGDYLSASIPASSEALTSPSSLPFLYKDRRRGTPVALPFAFKFYGQTFNTVYVGTNGYVRFDAFTDGNSSPPPFPSNSGGSSNAIAALWSNQTPDFQGTGYLLVDGRTGGRLIGPSLLHREAYMSRHETLVVDSVTGILHEVWQQKGATPDVLTNTLSGAEIWHRGLDPYGHPLDGSPITDWGPLTYQPATALTVGDGGLSHHPQTAADPSGKVFVTYERNDGSQPNFPGDTNVYHETGSKVRDDVMLVGLDGRTGAVSDPPVIVSARNAGRCCGNFFGIAATRGGSARVSLAWPNRTTNGTTLTGSIGAKWEALDTTGIGGAFREWFFAEGTTRSDFDEFLLVSNPNPAAVSVTVRYEKTNGSTQDQVVTVPANSRLTIQVWTVLGREVDHSTHVIADAPIVAERAMYFNHGFDAAGVVNGAHAALGETAARLDWDFAEGTTLGGFQEYLTLQNPNAAPAQVAITFGTESAPGVAGPVVTRNVTLAPTSRSTVNVNDPAQGVGLNVLGHATHVASTVPILAERPLYFSRTIDGIPVNGATVSFGVNPDKSFFLGEGNVLPGWAEFLTLANPDPAADITVDLSYQLEGGQPPIAKSVTVPKGARRTIQVFNPTDPGGIGRNVSDPISRGVSVKVTTGAGRGVVVERPLYFNSLIDKGLVVNDGTDKPGTPALAHTWLFAEGTSLPDFLTFWTISNPNPAPATISARYLTNLGEVVTRTFTVPANSRTTIQAYNPAQTTKGALGMEREGFATTFTADQPIVVERPLYDIHLFPDIATPINGGHVVIGLTGGD